MKAAHQDVPTVSNLSRRDTMSDAHTLQVAKKFLMPPGDAVLVIRTAVVCYSNPC